MKIKKIALLSILLLLLIVIPVSFALDNQTLNNTDVLSTNDYYFDSNIDENNGNGSLYNPYKELTPSNINDNSVIHLSSGEYDFNNNSKNINNVTIIGENSQTTFIKNAKFTVSTSFTLYNVTLISSTITNNGDLTALNTVFKQSSSNGVINSIKNIYLVNCSFINNAAEFGGAIYIKGGELTAKDSTFLNNQASMFGGAILSINSKINLTNLSGKNNKAKYDGGFVYSIYDTFIMVNSTFENNTADNGAVAYIDQATYNIIKNNKFINNSPQSCGVIYSLYNFNSTIENNQLADEELYQLIKPNMFIGNGNYTLYHYNEIEITEIPSKYNLADYGYVTSVKDQGNNGNCWAFATMATLESCILKALGDNYDLSESNLKNIFGNYGDYGWEYETNKGGIASMGYNYLISWLGPVLDIDDPYILDSIFSKVMNSIMHVQNVLFIQRKNLTDIDSVKKIIMTYGAVYSQINKLSGTYQYYKGGINANHAVTIVGWDDDLTFSGAPGKGGWIYKNSWGSKSGDQGYYYVSYYDTSVLPVGKIDAAFTFILNDTLKFDKNYQYDIQGKSDFFVNSSNTVWYKNKFISADNEYLAAVSTIFEKETNYTFSIYVNNEFKLSQSGFSKPGYYTFNLNNFIPLNVGDEFEVVFKIVVDNEAAFPISEKVSFMKCLYDANTSFLSYDGKNWVDLYDLTWAYSSHTYNSQVACIKAFTILNKVNTTTHLSLDGVTIKAQVLNEYGYVVNGGNVTFMVDGENYTVEVVNGAACLNILLNSTEYTISSVFNKIGHVSSNACINITLPIVNTSIVIEIDDKYPINVTAYVFDENNNSINCGNVTFTIAGDNHTVDVVNGVACLDYMFEISELYDISAVYNSIYYYDSSNNHTEFKVNLINTNIQLIVSDYNPVYINAIVTDEYGKLVDYGNITYIVENTPFNVNIVNGSAYLSHIFKTIGLNSIHAIYNGFYYYNSSEIILNHSIKSTIISRDATKTYNSNYEFKLLDNYGNPLVNSEVKVILNSQVHTLKTNNQGIVNLPVYLNQGSYSILITNPINGEVKTQNIKVVSRIGENNAVSMYYGAGKYYTVRVFDDNGNVAKGVSVKFTINNHVYSITTDNNGYASIKISLSPGSYTITAEYKGFRVSDKVNIKSTIITKNINVKKGKTIKFTVKLVNKNGKILKNKKITIKFKGKTYKVKTNKKGNAVLKITKRYKVGKYTIIIKYGKLSVKNIIRIKK